MSFQHSSHSNYWWLTHVSHGHDPGSKKSTLTDRVPEYQNFSFLPALKWKTLRKNAKNKQTFLFLSHIFCFCLRLSVSANRILTEWYIDWLTDQNIVTIWIIDRLKYLQIEIFTDWNIDKLKNGQIDVWTDWYMDRVIYWNIYGLFYWHIEILTY